MPTLKKVSNFRPRLGARTETAEEQIIILQNRVDALESLCEEMQKVLRALEIERPNGS